ncbi:hypothetical protein QBC38DRAFT_478156 [Podospora fimiseda]|uniref:Uncharacterized protein n=1 Tax=Podospora fimiseda TaxID=252190 RepID=A0AAN7H2K5_9PEZI|nr:hypothetical protein QBC38DRAFT_478156 [Podospora fimiseda]
MFKLDTIVIIVYLFFLLFPLSVQFFWLLGGYWAWTITHGFYFLFSCDIIIYFFLGRFKVKIESETLFPFIYAYQVILIQALPRMCVYVLHGNLSAGLSNHSLIQSQAMPNHHVSIKPSTSIALLDIGSYTHERAINCILSVYRKHNILETKKKILTKKSVYLNVTCRIRTCASEETS